MKPLLLLLFTLSLLGCEVSRSTVQPSTTKVKVEVEMGGIEVKVKPDKSQ